MAWNESDNGNKNHKNDKNRDPWGGKNEGPPDLDEALKKFQAKISQLFGGKNGFKPTKNSFGSGGLGLIGLALVLTYALSGIYIVGPAEEAVVTRFGRYERTEIAGPHWVPRFIERAQVVDVMRVESTTHGGEMLTMDENIIDAKLAVQYRISNARDYLFNMIDPSESLKQVSESALRAVVGQSSLNEILTIGRAEITKKIRQQVQEVLDGYQSGLQIVDLAMQQTKPPAAVQDAFDDAIKAQQDEERYVNQAQAYARKHVPIAEGNATRVLEEAKAYKEQVILLARGETTRFAKLLPEYRLNPQVMRDRMYLDTMQQVYANTTKILVNVQGGNNIMMLPLDRMMRNNQPRQSKISDLKGATNKTSAMPTDSASVPALSSSARPTYEDIERLKYTQNEGA